MAKRDSFVIASLNFGPKNVSDNEAKQDLLAVSEVADIICLQEAGDRKAVINWFLRTHPTWSVYYSRLKPGSGKVPILYRSVGKFKKRRGRTRLAWWGKRWVGAGAGPSRIGPKAHNRLILQLRGTAHVIVVINQHLVASATRANLPADALRARRRAYTAQIDTLLALVPRRYANVLVTGDFNATFGFPLLSRLWKKFRLDNRIPTHGKRLIDFIARKRGGELIPVRAWNMNVNSDHDAALVEYWFK